MPPTTSRSRPPSVGSAAGGDGFGAEAGAGVLRLRTAGGAGAGLQRVWQKHLAQLSLQLGDAMLAAILAQASIAG